MRFLLGLILGAGAVLLLAEGLAGNVDWRARFDSAIAGAERWVERVRTTVERNAVPPAPADQQARVALADAGAPADAGASGRAAPPPDAAEQSDVQPPSAPEAPATEWLVGTEPRVGDEPAAQPIPRPPDPQPTEPARPERAAQQTGKRNAVDVLVASTPPSAPLSSADDSAPKSQTVWVPFHSEMSASGFAARLTESVDHPFRVVRKGPGTYQVVFAYLDELERQALLDRAAAATGLPL